MAEKYGRAGGAGEQILGSGAVGSTRGTAAQFGIYAAKAVSEKIMKDCFFLTLVPLFRDDCGENCGIDCGDSGDQL